MRTVTYALEPHQRGQLTVCRRSAFFTLATRHAVMHVEQLQSLPCRMMHDQHCKGLFVLECSSMPAMQAAAQS